jgi:hypothetical protein
MTAIQHYDAKLATTGICSSFAQHLSDTVRIDFVSAYWHMQKNVY